MRAAPAPEPAPEHKITPLEGEWLVPNANEISWISKLSLPGNTHLLSTVHPIFMHLKKPRKKDKKNLASEITGWLSAVSGVYELYIAHYSKPHHVACCNCVAKIVMLFITFLDTHLQRQHHISILTSIVKDKRRQVTNPKKGKKKSFQVLYCDMNWLHAVFTINLLDDCTIFEVLLHGIEFISF